MEEESRAVMFAEKQGMKLSFTAAGVFVKSCKGHWIATKSSTGWRLMHENLSHRGPKLQESYHEQAGTYPSLENALLYIKAHDHVRYTVYEQQKQNAAAFLQ